MLTIRHFVPSDNEYQEICRVHNAEWSDHPNTVENIKWGDENWNDEYLFQRFVAELGGEMIAEGAYMQPFWSLKPGKFQFGWSLDPAYSDYRESGHDLHHSLFDYVLQELSTHEPKILKTNTREDKQDRVEFLTQNGFRFQMRYPESELVVDDFDFDAYAALPNKMAQKGIEITPLAQLMEDDPNWLNKIYELDWELIQDVPMPDRPTREPLDEFKKTFDSPRFLAEGWFVAVDTTIDESSYTTECGRGNYVGVSMLGVDNAMPEKMHTWLTGVVRSYRRQGVCTAMKVRAIELAKRRGAKTIDTGNEENNPMYHLNLRLGFKPKAAWADYQKEL